MIRWLLALTIVAGVGAALVASVRLTPAAPAAAPDDELLAFELEPSSSVLLKVPAGTDEVALTTWCVVEPRTTYDPLEIYPYALRVEYLALDGRLVDGVVFEPETRVSLRDPQSADGRSAWLADANDWVTDSRTLNLSTGKKLPAGGSLRVALLPGEAARMLVRATFRERRRELERAAHEGSLSLPERRRLMGQRSSLGSGDLGEPGRASALDFWGRRLDAMGIEGRDFHVRRLLLFDTREPLRRMTVATTELAIGARHAVAINVSRPVTLEVFTPVGREVRSPQGGVVVAEQDRLGERVTTVSVPISSPRTVVLRGATSDDVPVRIEASASDASAQLGAVTARPRGDERVELGPDRRTLRFHTLDPEHPVTVRVSEGQREIRLVVRGEQRADDTRDLWETTLHASWQAPGPSGTHPGHAAVVLPLAHSPLDRAGGDRP